MGTLNLLQASARSATSSAESAWELISRIAHSVVLMIIGHSLGLIVFALMASIPLQPLQCAVLVIPYVGPVLGLILISVSAVRLTHIAFSTILSVSAQTGTTRMRITFVSLVTTRARGARERANLSVRRATP